MTYSDKFIQLAKDGKIPESTIAKMAEFKAKLEAHSFVKTAYTGGSGAGASTGWNPPPVKTANAGASIPGKMDISKVLLLAGAMGAAPLIIGKATSMVENILLNRKKGPAFQAMLEAHPTLKTEDQELLARYFDSMWHFSPHLAQDPLAAGAYIRSAMQYHGVYGGPSPNMAKDINTLQRETRQDTTKGTGYGDYFLSRVPGIDPKEVNWGI